MNRYLPRTPIQSKLFGYIAFLQISFYCFLPCQSRSTSSSSEINKLELIQENQALSEEEIIYFQQCHTNLGKILDDEETYWQQRARLKWLLEGDRNTKFFHISAIARKKNYIYSLEIDGHIEYDSLIIFRHINTYYRNLLGIEDTRLVSLSHDFWADTDKLTDAQAQ
jgi:hypothetical protein